MTNAETAACRTICRGPSRSELYALDCEFPFNNEDHRNDCRMYAFLVCSGFLLDCTGRSLHPSPYWQGSESFQPLAQRGVHDGHGFRPEILPPFVLSRDLPAVEANLSFDCIQIDICCVNTLRESGPCGRVRRNAHSPFLRLQGNEVSALSMRWP
jgi:hypothetical protein